MNSRIAWFVTLGLLLATAYPASARKWTDNTRKFSVEADLVHVKGGKAILKKTDGKVIVVPLDRLSAADRRYLATLNDSPTNEPLRPAPEVIAAWEKAGAESGWMSLRGDLDSPWLRKKPVAGGAPAFLFGLFPTGKLNVLPPPEVPFGLKFESVTDAGLKELAGLKQLRTLNLWATKVTDAGLKGLAGLKQLQSLNLESTKVTGAGLKELAGLTQLQSLSLAGTQLTDAGLNELARLKQLQSLSLAGTQLTDAGLKELAGLKQLRTLSLWNTRVTDAGLKELAGLTQLQSLDLNFSKLTDAGLKAMGRLKQLQLQTLNLGSQVTDAGLKGLAGPRQSHLNVGLYSRWHVRLKKLSPGKACHRSSYAKNGGHRFVVRA